MDGRTLLLRELRGAGAGGASAARIRAITDAALEVLSPEFGLYAKAGRPSIPPEKLLRALLLQAFYSIRSERQLMEQMDYNLLFRWFVGLSMDAPVWDVTVFTKNREHLLGGDVAARFLAAAVASVALAFTLGLEALHRRPCLDHGSRRQAVPQGQWPAFSDGWATC